jgi:hypothetical protein
MSCTDAVASQTRFLGASIQQYDSSIGWNGSGGYCNITVVEDKCRNTSKITYNNNGENAQIVTTADMFNPPKLGTPVTFKFGAFTYSGLLQSWVQNNKLDGKAYDIKLVDPSLLLSGTQIILGSYIGQTFGIPNLINAYAFLENSYGTNAPIDPSLLSLLSYTPVEKYGGATFNEAGISWLQVRTALITIANSASPLFTGSYGGRITMRDNAFFLDISEVPSMGEYFRLSGDCLSLMDIISQVCEYSCRDYFSELVYSNGSYFIKIRVVNRYEQPKLANLVDRTVNSASDLRLNQGAITSLIGDGSGTIGNSRGLELRDEVTNCFLVGDYRSDMWQITYDGDADGYTDTIWPYWGLDSNGVPILGSGFDENHSFTIDSSQWEIDGIDGDYTVTMEELRLAAEGISSWETCLLRKHPELSNLAICREIGSDWSNPEDFKQRAFQQGKLRGVDLVDTSHNNVLNMSKIDQEYKVLQLYGFINNLAQNYYGKKYMVALPYIASAWSQDEPYSIKLNFRNADSAWVENTTLGLAYDSLYIEKFRNDDGRIKGFVHLQVDSDEILDLTQFPQDSYVRTSPSGAYVASSCEDIVFLNPTTRTYPRAVISIPGTACVLKGDIATGTLKQIWGGIFNPVFGMNPTANEKAGMMQIPNMQNVLFSDGIRAVLPDGAAVPLQSTTLTYGPWVANRRGIIYLASAGQTRYIHDSNLNPWSYGSVSLMDYAGATMVDSQISNQQVVELGNVEMAGGPILSKIGDTLVNGGPEVTDVRCSLGINGLTTSYSFRTYTPNFGRFGEVKANLLKFGGQWKNKSQSLFKKAALARKDNTITTSNNLINNIITRPDRYSKQSAGTFLIGQNIQDVDDSGCYRNTVGITDMRKCLPELRADNSGEYRYRAGMELGGLVRPYSTKYNDGSHLSCFNNISGYVGNVEYNIDAACTYNKYDYTYNRSFTPLPPIKDEGNCPITFTTLNPFLGSGYSSLGWFLGSGCGHDIEYVVRDGVYPTDLCVRHPYDNYSHDDWYRAVALKGPLVIAGWGYDIYGKPVPNSGFQTAYFKENWLRRPQDWKCGPVDLRWDNKRGVWTSPPSFNIIPFVAQDTTSEDIFGAHISISDAHYQYTSSGTLINKKIIRINNLLEIPIVSGMKGFCYHSDYNSYGIYDTTHQDNSLANYENYYLLTLQGDTPVFSLETIGLVATNPPKNSRVISASWGGYATTSFYTSGNPVYSYSVPDISGFTFSATTATQFDGQLCFIPTVNPTPTLAGTMVSYTQASLGNLNDIRTVQNSFNTPSGVGITAQWAANQGWVITGTAAYQTPVAEVI